MKFTDKVPLCLVDLDQPPENRWQLAIERSYADAQRLIEQAEEDYQGLSVFARAALRIVLGTGYRVFGGLYVEEMRAWAYALGRSLNDIILANCAYELSHLGAFATSIYGCTAGIKYVPGMGNVHVRNLDWPLSGVGRATRLFVFKRRGRVFNAVGVAGHVGVLSGMVPYKYSVTINWAPPTKRPCFAFGPSFLLREVLETCDTYEDACSALKETPLSTAVFFTVCGSRKNQACVIARNQAVWAVRKPCNHVIAQANHCTWLHPTEIFGGQEVLEYSQEREDALDAALRSSNAMTLDGVADALDVEDVLNGETYQQMAFCPRTGEVKVWRCV